MVKIGKLQGSEAMMDTSGKPGPDNVAELHGALPSAANSGALGIAARLHQAVLEGVYSFGERLPAERELALHFGTSRSTVREALKRLEAMNLVARRIGSGTFVTYQALSEQQNVADLTSPIELIEVRLAVEPQILRLAIANATTRDVRRMEEALAQLVSHDGGRTGFSAADEAFHMALAECTRNPLMVSIYRAINEVKTHTQWGQMKEKILTPENIALYNEHHARIVEALKSRDVDAGVAAITEHLEKARQDLLGAK